MKFAIRDDDTSYFTRPEDLEQAYDFIADGPISLSVVPYTVPVHRDDVFPYGKGLEMKNYPLGENPALVEFLKQGIQTGKYDILLHGYAHEYQKIDGQWTAEMMWKPEERLMAEIPAGKQYLEDLLDTKIRIFVAPNNAISQAGIHAVEACGMDYSGIIQFRDRDINGRYLWNFVKRWSDRIFTGVPYAGVLNYGKHKELVGYTLDDPARLRREYELCKKRNVPFVVYTHYWGVNQDANTKNLLRDIYNYCIEDGAELAPLSACF